MKQSKQRIIAIDYFRGVCMLAVILNHSVAFSTPFAYLSGVGQLWTSAAEFFLLLSGLTFGIVRGGAIVDDFQAVIKKTWRRAASIYLLNLLVVAISMIMALYFATHQLNNDVLGSLPTASGFHLLWSILNLSYGIGWASFLALYSVFLIFAPFALYILKTKHWYSVPLLSLALFCVNYSNPAVFGYSSNFMLWQTYFVMGMVLARFRVEIISYLYSLKQRIFLSFRRAVFGLAAMTLIVNVLLNFNLSPTVATLANRGWLPIKFESAYIKLLNHRNVFDIVFMNSRTGVLRPAITLLFLAAFYLFYQEHKNLLLLRTGRIFNTLGRDTLWVFMAQAIAIPILAVLPLQRSLVNNLLLTSFLLLSMWAITQRKRILQRAHNYSLELAQSFTHARYAAMYRQLDE